MQSKKVIEYSRHDTLLLKGWRLLLLFFIIIFTGSMVQLKKMSSFSR